MRLDYTMKKLTAVSQRKLSLERERFLRLVTGLDAMSPLKVLSRGYAIVQQKDGSVLKNAASAVPGEYLDLRLERGSLECQVCAVREEEQHG